MNTKPLLLVALSLVLTCAMTPLSAEMTTFEFRIANNSDTDLVFRLDQQTREHIKFSPQTDGKDRYTIPAGKSDVVVLTPTGHKCAPWCGGCTAAKGRVWAMYRGEDGKLVDNNYFKATYGFSEYCDEAGDKPITTYSSSWDFAHHRGDGTDKYPHEQNHTTPVYTKGSPVGNTFEASKTAGHANITYSNK